MSKAWEGGSTRRWRKTRARVLLRDQYQCQLQLDVCTGTANQVHHTLGRGVSEADIHLVAACMACNLKTGDPRRTNGKPRMVTEW